MKKTFLFLSVCAFLAACQPPVDNSATEAFEKNCEVALAQITGWENESLDYDAIYAEDALLRPTGFDSPDSMTLADMKVNNEQIWGALDFELVTDVYFLPGVNADTKKPDGSVRYYGIWKVTVPATDSTEAHSGELKYYESFDFNEEGKIVFQQGYGDFGGLMKHLNEGHSEDEAEADSESEEFAEE